MLTPDIEEITKFVEVLFKHADPDGYVALRSFRGDSTAPWLHKQWNAVRVGDNLGDVVVAAAALAGATANSGINAVFCPPVATFRDKGGAGEANLHEGLVILVDCDDKCKPAEALTKLSELIGPPTLVVASGGITEGQDKLHLYWRLTMPTRTPDEHLLLKVCRQLAARLVGADISSGPACHPIRWAGSWHLKAQPRLARIVAGDASAEVDLASALAVLRGACGDADDSERHSGIGEAPLEDVSAALALIPNADLGWEEWNNIGMAIWRATGGSEEGLAAWCSWSAKSAKNDARETMARWRHYRISPPNRIGGGTLFFLARQYSPDFRRPSEVVPPLSDEGLALLMAERYGGEIRFTAQWGRWHHWTGAYWREDKTLVSVNLAREVCRSASRTANKQAKAVASARTVTAITGLIRADRRVASGVEQWDCDPWLLGSPGGTTDLRTGVLLANGIDNYITKVTRVTPGGDCLVWKGTLSQIFGGQQDMVDYAQRICGYCLTGVTREELMFFLHGGGGNGKGTFIETMCAVMGGYATTVAMSTLIITKHSEHPTEIAKLCGARLAVASETNDAARWNAAKIKLLTGSDNLTGRFMRADFFDFPPTHKLVVSSNRKPMLGRVDYAIKRRTVLLPFEVTFSGDAVDKRLKEKLLAESGGILLWAIDGCLKWQRWGMCPPDSVVRATEEYLHDQDDVQVFIDERCVDLRGDETRTRADRERDLMPSTDLYEAWVKWCENTGGYAGSKKDFSQRLADKFESKKYGNRLWFYDVRLLSGTPEPPSDFNRRVGGP